MDITDAIGIMESVAGVTDAATPVGDAWALILNHIHHPPQPVAPLKELPDFVAGYQAGLHDGRLEYEAAADLLAQRHPQPVPVSERPWEREGWCDESGRCWWGRAADEYCNHDWHYATRAEVEDFCSDAMPQVVLPAHALPLPS